MRMDVVSMNYVKKIEKRRNATSGMVCAGTG